MLVTPLAEAMLVMLAIVVGCCAVVETGGSGVTVSSGTVVLPPLVTFAGIPVTVGSNVGSVVGGSVMSGVVPEGVVSDVETGGGGSVAVVLPLVGGLVGSRLVGSGVVVGGGTTVSVGTPVSVALLIGGGMTVVGSPVGSSVTGGVVSAMVELPVPGKSESERLIPSGVEVGSGGAVVGSAVGSKVGEGCSDSGTVGEAEADGSTVGSADGEADGDDGSSETGTLVTGAVGAVSVMFGDGRMALVTSETTLLMIEPMGAKGSLRVGVGSSVALVTMPVGARSIPLVLVGSDDVSAEENNPDAVGSVDGLAVSEGAAESVGEADSGAETSELVGRTIVSGMPPVEPTPPAASVGLSTGDASVTGSATELVGVGSVAGDTTMVL